MGGLFLFCIFPASAMIFHVDPISEFSVRASMAAFYSFQSSFCVSAIQQRRYSCSAVDGYLQFLSPLRETNLSLSMA